MSLNFKYKILEGDYSNDLKKPTIKITLQGNNVTPIDVMALLDSGADVSVIPKGLADYLNLELKDKTTSKGIGGEIVVWTSSMNIEVGELREKHILRNIPVQVAEDDGMPIILGRAGFFKEFIITINERKQKIKEFFSKVFKGKKLPVKTEERIKEEQELEDLEKQIRELGKSFEEEKEVKKLSLFGKLLKGEGKEVKVAEEQTEKKEEIKKEAKIEEKKDLSSQLLDKKVKEEIERQRQITRKRKGKSRKFIKCHKLLLKADKALETKDNLKAKRLYFKARNAYVSLEYIEKKELYDELMQLYNKLSGPNQK